MLDNQSQMRSMLDLLEAVDQGVPSKQLNENVSQSVAEGEKTMSRAAKGYEKYGKKGMMALAKAGRDDAGEEKLDAIRNKYDRYDNDTKKDVTEGENSSPEMAALQDTVDFATKHGYQIKRSKTGKKSRFINKKLEHTVDTLLVPSEGELWVSFEDHNSGMSGNDPAEVFAEVFADMYEQALRDHKFRNNDNDYDEDDDENYQGLKEDSGGEIEVNFMNSGTGQKLGMKTVQNMGISLDSNGRPVMKVSSPFASGNTLMANFDSRTGGWVVDID